MSAREPAKGDQVRVVDRRDGITMMHGVLDAIHERDVPQFTEGGEWVTVREKFATVTGTYTKQAFGGDHCPTDAETISVPLSCVVYAGI